MKETLPSPFGGEVLESVVLMGRHVFAAGGRVREVRFNRVADQAFYAEIAVVGPHGKEVINAGPSDALAVALHARAPILAAAALPDVSAVTGIPLRESPSRGTDRGSDSGYGSAMVRSNRLVLQQISANITC